VKNIIIFLFKVCRSNYTNGLAFAEYFLQF